MITKETLAKLGPQHRDLISGLLADPVFIETLLMQIEVNNRSVVDGTEDEPPAELAQRILDVRRHNRIIQDLLDLGAEHQRRI